MANATDFLGAVYDTLARMLNLDSGSSGVFMQMAWPGYSLSPADFKRMDMPGGAYDPATAQEVFSHLANIAPTFNRLQFENSGYEVDDLYEIVLSSAMPAGAPAEGAGVNPAFHLFSDAQYEFQQARRGSASDPNTFYYPCVATPSNWYDEAAVQSWSSVDIKSTDIQPIAASTTAFSRAGGPQLAGAGVWKYQADRQTEPAIKATVAQALAQQTGIRPIAATAVLAAAPRAAAAAPAHFAAVATLRSGRASPAMAAVPVAETAVARAPIAIKKSETTSSAAVGARVSALRTLRDPAVAARVQALDLKAKPDLRVGNTLNLAQQVYVWNLINQKLPAKPAAPDTNGFTVSFKFCRVNIDRAWLKLALLSTKNWYIPSTPAREYSTGNADSNPGSFPLLPVSFIVVRDLKITANWSQQDKDSLGKSVAFGFFDIRNSTLNANTLEIKGMQIVAWLSKLTPAMPPVAPPA